MPSATFTIERGDATKSVEAALVLSGDWTAAQMRGVAARLTAALKPYEHIRIRQEGLEALDTAGALVLCRATQGRLSGEPFLEGTPQARLFALVSTANAQLAAEEMPQLHGFSSARLVTAFLSGLGRVTTNLVKEVSSMLVFVGQLVWLLAMSLSHLRHLRVSAMVNIIQRAGLEALPIVIVTNIFVGAVIAFLGVIQLQQFGASIFAVDLTGMAVFRELAPMMAAILLAGRSASSFAAEIGAMRMTQEIDAMTVMGIGPYESLIVPRVVGLMIMMPLVTFMGMMGGLLGGALAIWEFLDYDPEFFITRIWDYVPPQHFVVGMIKTPVFALFIAVIGCRAGLTVKEDVISLGRQVTSAVVQAIFIIIMLDAAFAIAFQEMGL